MRRVKLAVFGAIWPFVCVGGWLYDLWLALRAGAIHFWWQRPESLPRALLDGYRLLRRNW